MSSTTIKRNLNMIIGMSNSVVKVTETPHNDSLILVIGEDGTISPDKATVQEYLSTRTGETDVQIMKVNKSDGKNMDVTLDTLTYLANHEEEEVAKDKVEEMDEIARNLNSFRMDHDYTPFTSPRRPDPVEDEILEDDDLAQTLSILEGTDNMQALEQVPSISTVKVVKTTGMLTQKKLVTIKRPVGNKVKARNVQNISIFKQPNKLVVVKPRVVKPNISLNVEPQEEEKPVEEDSTETESEYSEDDEDDSDFDIDSALKQLTKKPNRTRAKLLPQQSVDTSKLIKLQKTAKTASPKTKVEPESSKVEKPLEPVVENKALEKKPIPKKEKKTPKPIPDDFALFSSPDIIRRVGGKSDNGLTPTTPESPKSIKPARIFPTTSKRSSSESIEKRHSTDGKSNISEKDTASKNPVHRLSLSSETKTKDKRLSLDDKVRRQSLDTKTDKIDISHSTLEKVESHVSLQNIEDASGNNSNQSMVDNHLEPMPSAEDIRTVMRSEGTKNFTSSMVIPESSVHSTEHSIDQTNINLETASLDLDQSILDNINSDLIPEDILYQVAQSLVDNPELQNAIDKSLVDGNLVLDTPIPQNINHEQNTILIQQNANPQTPPNQMLQSEQTRPTSVTKGTQVVRSGGRVVVIPPIERPATRSRNKKQLVEAKQTKSAKILDAEHISGGELDSDSDDEKSDDDPDKLWCICNQPHNNRFMICCDTCEEWYHGKCVNVTKAMGQMMEQQGKEWICIYCKDISLQRPAAAARRVRKASRTSITDLTSNDGKSESVPSSPLNSPTITVPGCLVCSKPCRTNSIYCSDPCILKHAKVVEKVVVFERSSGRILSGNNAPTAANLEQWLQQNPGFEVVRSTNANKPITTKPLTQSKLKIVRNPGNQGGVSLAVQKKGANINILKHLPKHQIKQQNSLIPPKAMIKNITGLKIISKNAATPSKTKLIQLPPSVDTSMPSTSSSKFKLVQTTIKTTPPTLKEKPMPQKTPKSRQSEEVTPSPKKEENIRDNVQKTLFEQLTNRLKLANDLKLNKEEIAKISGDIELQLYKCFGDTGQKYRNKYRSLIFNIKDIKNQTLWRRICEKSISPYQLVRLSPDDMASQELALWRERENKHQLEMITKSELEQLGRTKQYVFKTHKGEQELEDNRPTDAVEKTEVVMDLGADGSSESATDSKKDLKDKSKKSSKSTRSNRDKDYKSSKEVDKTERKGKKRDHRSISKDKSRRKRSRSKEKNRSRSTDRDRHRHSSHKSSKYKKNLHSTTDKLDKKSKEILEQLVDNKIVPPLEDRLWKHVQEDDITTAPNIDSDSDHEPTSTVTIPTPPRTSETEESNLNLYSSNDVDLKREDTQDDDKSFAYKSSHQVSHIDGDGSESSPKSLSDFLWKGTINMVDVAQISITAHEVSGDCMGLGTELPPCLDVVGRISPETVWDYIGKMKCSNSKTISLIRLTATNVEEKMPYIALYSYLSSRNRLGVVKSLNKAVKDFYILPLSNQKPIPQALLPLNGPGFEESRPALLLGILVRDKRKRPLFIPNAIPSKKIKVDGPISSSSSVSLPVRSYTPPPTNADPLLKQPSTTLKEIPKDDMDEPYNPEDFDPEESTPNTSKSSAANVNTSELSNMLTDPVKTSSFLETSIKSQTFEPFTSKFDTIPGLDENTSLPASSQELQRKMEELDQCIAIHKAEIDNMSQNISTTTGIGTSALANIALPSNIRQILDSIKSINPASGDEASQTTNKESKTTENELTIPLMLPKISARSHQTPSSVSPSSSSSPTIPLNLPKKKSKFSASNSSPTSQNLYISNKLTSTCRQKENDKSASSSVLSSLSEEDLIRKAAEMLGEDEDTSLSKTQNVADSNYVKSTVGHLTSFNASPVVYPPPSNLIPTSSKTLKSSKLDISQPPIPGLDD